MRSLLLPVAMAAVLAVAIAPGTLAGEPDATPVAPAIGDPNPTPTATPAGPYDGDIVVDPTFVSGGELPTQAPVAAHGAPRPRLTPPPTDAVSDPAASGASMLLPFLVLATAGLLALAVAASPRSLTRRRRRRRHP